MTLEIGQIVDGKYRITRLLGQGAMGAVFEGDNVRIHRKVAIKVLHAAVAARKDLVDRFEREAQAAGRIGSKHIVEVLDLGELPDGSRYLVMEYLQGASLTAKMTQCGRMLPQYVLPLLRQLLVGLGAAHDAGIVHRDLKPDNVYLVPEGAGQRDFVKILDFGVSKFSPLSGEEARMTKTGAVMGTPYYMSPEQAKGARDLDARSDLFAVGVILYEAVTGTVPFDGETFNELMFKIALQDPPPPETIVPGLHPGIGRMIRKAMARDPAQRFQNAAAFCAAIDEWMATGHSTHSEPPPGGAALSEAYGPGRTLQGAPAAGALGAPHAGTKATWSTSGVGAPKPSRLPLALGAVAAVALLGAAGSAFVFRDALGLGGAAAAPEKTAELPKPAPDPVPEPARSAEPAAAIETAAEAPSAAPAETASPEPSAAAPSPKQGKGVAASPKATSAPTATAKATAAPQPTSTGRKVREDI